MLPPIPVVTVRIDRVVPNPWRTKKRSGSYALYIGRVLKVEHWDRVKKRPKSELSAASPRGWAICSGGCALPVGNNSCAGWRIGVAIR